MLIPGFEVLEELQVSTGSLVMKGIRDQTGEKVIIKTLAGDYPDLRSMARIRHEYSLAKAINHSGIVRPLELISFSDRIAIIYEDFGGVPLDIYLREHTGLLSRLRLSCNLADILGHIHNENIIHKDLKPGNMIINPETEEIKITDFGISTRLEKETLEYSGVSQLEGSLPYVSPEQTGRMNRSLDYRTDIYSFGVTLYEIFTGKLPFYGEDAIELIYGHIAKKPLSPQVVDPEIPVVLGDIILKCMAKKSEDRYQSAFGLKKDLQFCLDSLDKDGEIKSFRLARHDISSKFRLSQTLYGREDNIAELMQGLDLVVNQRSALYLVSGYSGIGKSSAINELQSPVAQKRGWFLKGKFDQFRRNIPYAAFIQAFSDMIAQVLGDYDTVVNQWKKNIREALGDYGKILTGVIPDLELITGSLKNLPELDPDEELNKFYLTFKTFIKAISRAERPLVLCIDDLQWADSGSLDLIETLICDPEVRSLLVICTFRSNEVNAIHPVAKMIRSCIENGGIVKESELKPLSPEHNLRLIADSLLCSHEEALTLAKLVYSKTQGNPFFTGQLLKNIYDEGLLRFSLAEGKWTWDISEIREKNISDNVISLMEERLGKLPQECLYFLQLASCLGASFSLEMIALVVGKPRSYVLSTLIHAIHEGIVLSPAFDYKSVIEKERQGGKEDLFGEQHYLKFVHDRIQQAAYQPIYKSKKRSYRLKIGRLLLRQYISSPEALAERSFEIVGHLNEGLSLVTEEKELILISTLNLKAGIKAKEAAAFRHALEFLDNGIKALGDRLWMPEFTELSYKLNYHIAESLYLNRDHEALEKLSVKILSNLKNPVWKAQVYMLMMNLRLYQGRVRDAFNIGVRSLGFLGVHVPRGNMIFLKIVRELLIAKLHSTFLRDDIVDHIKISKNPDVSLKAKVLADTFAIAQEIDLNITGFLTLKLFNQSFEEGFSEYSIMGYIASGHILKVAFGDWEVTNRMSSVAVRLIEKFRFVRSRGQFYGFYGFTIAPWYKPPKESLKYLRKGLASAQELGNSMWATFCSSMISMQMHLCDVPLDEHFAATEESGQLSGSAGILESVICYRSHLEFICGLSSVELHQQHLTPEDYHPWSRQTTIYVQNKIKQLYILGEYESAWLVFYNNIEKIHSNPDYFPAAPMIEFYFYLCLVLYQVNGSGSRQKRARKKWLRTGRKYIFKWAKKSPLICEGRKNLVVAEEYNSRGRLSDAIREYDKAIDWSSDNGLKVLNGIANENAAKAWLQLGKPKLARAYILESRFQFEKWGAKVKVSSIDIKYRELLLQVKLLSAGGDTAHSKTSDTTSTRFQSHSFDADTVIKFSRAVASEIRIGDLLKKIMRFIIENAGAQHGFLMLKKTGSDQLFIEASGHADRETLLVLESVPLESSSDLSIGVVQYVYRTQKTLVLDDASRSTQFGQDKYIQEKKPGSVLCAPIMHQGKLLGTIYLENNLVSDAFVGDRMNILEVLVSQTAVSIQNALHYANMEEQVKTRTRQLQQKTREMADILGNIDQAILTFNQDMTLNQGHSAKTKEYFPEFSGDVSGLRINQIFTLSSEKTIEFRRWLELLYRKDAVRRWRKFKLLSPIKTMKVVKEGEEKTLEFDFQPVVENEKITRVMVLGSDITEKQVIEKQLLDTRKSHELQMERVMALVLHDREVVIGFVNECREIMKRYAIMVDVKNLSLLMEEAFRDVHTMKGNAGAFGLNNLALLLEKAEDFFTSLRKKENRQDVGTYFHTWSRVVEDILSESAQILEVRDLVFGSDINYISIPREAYESLLRNLVESLGGVNPELISSYVSLNSFPLKEMMRKYVNLVRDTYAGSGITLHLENPDFVVHKNQFSLFDTALVHLVRNALAHGFKNSESESGKVKDQREIRISCEVENGSMSFEVRDNGSGMRPDKIWEHAYNMGLVKEESSLSDFEKINLIFLPGFSTKSHTDRLSGRGVGMNAVKTHLESLGGGVRIESRPDKGTSVKIWLPVYAHLRRWYPDVFKAGQFDIA